MTPSDFYTDRVNGPVPRTRDELPEATSAGLYSLFRTKAQAHWFANQFPDHCEDGNGVAGTNHSALWDNVRALIPELMPTQRGEMQTDGAVFDLIEYGARRIAKPIRGKWHDFLKHHELAFDEETGRTEFREEVNQILQRGGTMYELNPKLQIVRVGTPAVQQVIQQMTPTSGDANLDALLARAKDLFLSRKAEDRDLALEKLWDAFERLKTIDVPGDKKQSANTLLDNIGSTEFRSFTSNEMKALTELGNQFMIRHHETDKHLVPQDAHDYLFARMGSLILYLLKMSNRLR